MIGNFLGGLAGYYRENRILKGIGILATGLQPIPSYIMSLLVLIIFGFVWPILPISGGFADELSYAASPFAFVQSIFEHSILPVLSLVLITIGVWFIGMRSLVSNIVYGRLRHLCRARGRRPPPHPDLLHHAQRPAPQLTGLTLSLGAIFNGAIITEFVFGYPGVGTLLIRAVDAGDYSLVLRHHLGFDHCGRLGRLLIDLLYPLIDPRVKTD